MAAHRVNVGPFIKEVNPMTDTSDIRQPGPVVREPESVEIECIVIDWALVRLPDTPRP